MLIFTHSSHPNAPYMDLILQSQSVDKGPEISYRRMFSYNVF